MGGEAESVRYYVYNTALNGARTRRKHGGRGVYIIYTVEAGVCVWG